MITEQAHSSIVHARIDPNIKEDERRLPFDVKAPNLTTRIVLSVLGQ